MEAACKGCGAAFQTEQVEEPGYAPAHVIERGASLCRRCYRLRHYSDGGTTTQPPEVYWQQLCKALKGAAGVIQVVDMLDLLGSWIPGLAPLVQGKPLWLVGSRVDLLPIRTLSRRAEHVVETMAREQGLEPSVVHLCSPVTGHGMRVLGEALAEELQRKTFCIVGTTNVGKSTWIRRLKGWEASDTHAPTASHYPGTTQAPLRIPFQQGTLVDMPGIVRADRMSEWLPLEETRYIVPTEPLQPRVHHLAAGQALFIGGLARLEIMTGERQPYAVCVANRLPIHRTQIARVEALWADHAGELLAPPHGERARQTEWVTHEFAHTTGRRWDLVISGLGWITMGQAPVRIRLALPKGIAVARRGALWGRGA